MKSVKVQSRGRLTLPADVREALGIGPGDRVTFTETRPGRFEVQAEARPGALLGQKRTVSRLEVSVPRSKRQMELPI